MSKRKYTVFILLLLLNNLFPQSLPGSKNLEALELLLNQPKQSLPTVSVPLEKVVDPNQYILGPGDVLLIVIDARSDYSNQVTVNPEGSVFIPAVGKISVANQSLAAVKEKLTTILKSKYVADKVDVMLLQVRTFRVTVSGAVRNAGMVTVDANSRVS